MQVSNSSNSSGLDLSGLASLLGGISSNTKQSFESTLIMQDTYRSVIKMQKSLTKVTTLLKSGSTNKISNEKANRISKEFVEITRSMNAILATPDEETDMPKEVANLQKSLREAVGKAFGNEGPYYKTDFGLKFNFREGTDTVIDFGNTNRVKFRHGLKKRFSAINELFFANPKIGGDGLIERINGALHKAESSMKKSLLRTGSLVDVIV